MNKILGVFDAIVSSGRGSHRVLQGAAEGGGNFTSVCGSPDLFSCSSFFYLEIGTPVKGTT